MAFLFLGVSAGAIGYLYYLQHKNDELKMANAVEQNQQLDEFILPVLRDKLIEPSVVDNRGGGYFNITQELPPRGIYGGKDPKLFDPNQSPYLSRSLFERSVVYHPLVSRKPDEISDIMFKTLYTGTSYT